MRYLNEGRVIKLELESTSVKKVPFLVAKSTREEPLNEEESERLIAPPASFIPCQVESNPLSPEKSVYYNMMGKITFGHYLSTVQFSVGAVRALLRQIAEMLDLCTQAHLSVQSVVLDYEHVFFDASKLSLAFIYLPFNGMESDPSAIRAFFAELPSRMICSDAQAKRLMVEYGTYFQFNPHLDIRDFKKNLTALIETGHLLRSGNASQGHVSNASVHTPAKFPSQAGNGHQVKMHSSVASHPSSESASQPQSPSAPTHDADTTVLGSSAVSQDPFPKKAEPKAAEPKAAQPKVLHSTATPKASQPKAVQSTAPKPETTPLKAAQPQAEAFTPAQEKTVIQSSVQKSPSSNKPKGKVSYYLMSIGTGARIDLDKPEFTIGKSGRCDYRIEGNEAVSRVHAMFAIDDAGCSIADQESLNKTFVDDKKIVPFEKVRLSDGDRIKLGNAEFKFHISADDGS